MEKPAVRELFSLLREFGVKDVVCSPGSRNAFLLQEADSLEGVRCHIVVDERSAGFIALGLALAASRPVALICTSGSAVLNYSPALSEAFYQGVPLIAVSADRPYEWIDQDDSQTIRQYEVLANFVKRSYDIVGERKDGDYDWYVNRIVNEGMLEALSPKMGPVHFNIHLNGENSGGGKDLEQRTYRKVDLIKPLQTPDKNVIARLAEESRGKKIMLVAGFMPPDHKLQKAVMALQSLPNVCIMAETVSNLHLDNSSYMVDIPLFRLSPDEKKDLAPDILISVGGALISRQLKEFIRSFPPREHWSLGYSDVLVDCFKSLTVKIECNASYFIKALAKRLERIQGETKECNYQESWVKVRERYSFDLTRFPWSDLTALSVVLKSLPKETNLMLSNGTSVRYGQVIPYETTHATYANRGVSGIEGCTSTAVGLSIYYPHITCLITGDMSFSYDLAGLASGLHSKRLRIIVLDNNGGDIFRFIPSTRSLAIREKYLSIGKEICVKRLAQAFGFRYYLADSMDSLLKTMKDFFVESSHPSILHINTRNAENSKILRQFLTGNSN